MHGASSWSQELLSKREKLGGPWFEAEDMVVTMSATRIARWCKRQQRREKGTVFRVHKRLVDKAIDTIHVHQDGLWSLVHYLMLVLSFFSVIYLQRPVYSAFSVENGLKEAVGGVEAGGTARMTYKDVESVNDIYDWVDALVENLYDGEKLYMGSDTSTCHAKCTMKLEGYFPPGGEGGPSTLDNHNWGCGQCWSNARNVSALDSILNSTLRNSLHKLHGTSTMEHWAGTIVY
jgi:hypothetical protein